MAGVGRDVAAFASTAEAEEVTAATEFQSGAFVFYPAVVAAAGAISCWPGPARLTEESAVSFHIVDPQNGRHLFFPHDPRAAGFVGPVEVCLPVEMPGGLFDWPDVADRPSEWPLLWVSTSAPKRYRVFNSDEEGQRQGYNPLTRNWSAAHRRWTHYVTMRDAA